MDWPPLSQFARQERVEEMGMVLRGVTSHDGSDVGAFVGRGRLKSMNSLDLSRPEISSKSFA